jgi:enoyl-CoA hydratase
MPVTLESEGEARVVVVDRPERRHALDLAALREISAIARSLRADRSARGIVLASTPGTGVFLSGGDLQELAAVKTARGAREFAEIAARAWEGLLAVGVPLVAAVSGDTFGGGCEASAACDYRVVERRSRFQWVQARFAITTGWGGAANLLSLVPRGVATRWLLTAAPVTAPEALDAGFADEVVDDGQARARAVTFVHEVARSPRSGVARMLTLLRASRGMPPRDAKRLERKHFARSWASSEHDEAVRQFLARR